MNFAPAHEGGRFRIFMLCGAKMHPDGGMAGALGLPLGMESPIDQSRLVPGVLVRRRMTAGVAAGFEGRPIGAALAGDLRLWIRPLVDYLRSPH